MKLSTIDLRSDTVTLPTAEMLECMFSAKVGDDVWGEDPTVKRLEESLAAMFSKEAALFCPSGTMTNQIAIRVHTNLGDEIICDKLSHIYNYEGGGVASNSGASVRLIDGDLGRVSVKQIRDNLNPDDPHFAKTSLVSLENTVNKGGGSCYEYSVLQEISSFCKGHNLNLHLDGARIFNAIVKQSFSSQDYGKLFDTVSICLSKGLGAPIGSVLVGSHSFIQSAIRVRKSFGGGMRQVGYLAAAGQYAIENNIHRLSKDHKRASIIEAVLIKLSFIDNIRPVSTNIILFDVINTDVNKFVNYLLSCGIKASSMGVKTIRFVTHLGFTDDQLDCVISALKNYTK